MIGSRNASAHYFVDEKSVVLSVKETDTAWHAGKWDMNCRAIGVEMCSKKDANGKYYIPQATIENTVRLVRELMAKHNISANNVIRHYDVNGKHCPEPFVRDQQAWKAFVSAISKEDAAPQQKVAEWAREAWAGAKENGIMDGTRPLDGVTRQELAVILHRLNLI
jgi:N-acetylmuramoyl-L-alanine amidase